MSGEILQRPELAGGATVGGVEVINDDGVIIADAVAGAFDIGTNLTFKKGSNHTVAVTTSTVTNQTGGSLTQSGAKGDGTGAGGAHTIVGGASGGGATGAGGAASVTGGAAASTADVGGAASVTGGAGSGTGAGGVAKVVGGQSGGGSTGKGGAAQVTGGAAASSNDDGGSVVLTGGAKAGSGIAGVIFAESKLCKVQGTPTAKTVSATLTAAELLAGIVTINQAAAGASAQQLPTGTAIQNALPTAFSVDDSFDVHFINTSTVDAEDATVTVNTDVTIVGSPDLPAHSGITIPSSGTFRFRKTGNHVFVAYRIN
jgi:hypothetical protein